MNSRTDRVMLILGAAGFMGRQTIKEAVADGWKVVGLVRSATQANMIAQLGAQPVRGDALAPDGWCDWLATAQVMVDVIQPKLPRRVSTATVADISRYRQSVTRTVTAAIRELPARQRPLYVSVSGIDDLQPDNRGFVDHHSPLRTRYVGFAGIGIPVRRIIESAGITAVFVYLGTVYGPGKAWADRIIPALSRGRFPILGKGANHLPLVHVEDAAGAIVHLADMAQADTLGRSFVVADVTPQSFAEVLNATADMLNAPRPKHLPLWLARPILGGAMFETLTRDIQVDASALVDSGYRFRYPSFVKGISATLTELGMAQAVDI